MHHSRYKVRQGGGYGGCVASSEWMVESGVEMAVQMQVEFAPVVENESPPSLDDRYGTIPALLDVCVIYIAG